MTALPFGTSGPLNRCPTSAVSAVGTIVPVTKIIASTTSTATTPDPHSPDYALIPTRPAESTQPEILVPPYSSSSTHQPTVAPSNPGWPTIKLNTNGYYTSKPSSCTTTTTAYTTTYATVSPGRIKAHVSIIRFPDLPSPLALLRGLSPHASVTETVVKHAIVTAPLAERDIAEPTKAPELQDFPNFFKTPFDKLLEIRTTPVAERDMPEPTDAPGLEDYPHFFNAPFEDLIVPEYDADDVLHHSYLVTRAKTPDTTAYRG
ncbi:uncharacterized protein N0V89_001006 [Didymosphaeria variabile]|uniref:Uncharacterized protein n=1 Tax=Didymosphaeria variabile TaxID=1932322 RepID=A0A9W8XWA2_9PLEO|nr:uncharacterized protein N0V89_001006 [Didymosphaeria variabile]KAJ4360443.1 hypothetical protein N0V89_001006 [Didymosphaeria variabile]